MFGAMIYYSQYLLMWLFSLSAEDWLKVAFAGLVLALVATGLRGVGKFVACLGGVMLLFQYLQVLI